MKPFETNENDLESGKLDKDKDKATRSNRVLKMHNQALLSGLAYCVSSCSMILINKFVLSSYDFNAGISLMLYQVVQCNCCPLYEINNCDFFPFFHQNNFVGFT
jgi:GDP-mannose transporter